MVDTAQVIYEYTAGNTLSFWVDGLKIEARRPGLYIDTTVDGTMIVTDTSASQLVFSGTATNVTGANYNTLLGVQRAAIDYTGGYPRLTTITLVGGTTLTNIEVAMTKCVADDQGYGLWSVTFEFVEKDK